jgi:hypothetical protein
MNGNLNFLAKNNRWNQNNPEFNVAIDSGKLHIEKLKVNKISNGCLWYKKRIDNFNALYGFSITFYAKILSYGDIFNAIDMQWGIMEPGSNSLYQVDIAPTGIRLAYFENGTGWNYFDHFQPNEGIESSEMLPKSVFNKIEIKQFGDSLLVSINDKLFYKRRIKRIAGNSIGIQQCLKGAWEIDSLVVRQVVY